jgi:hypothetical protein
MIDMFYFLVMFLIFGIVILVSIYVWGQMGPAMNAFFGPGQAQTVMTTTTNAWRAMDYIFMGSYFLMCGLPILFATMVRNSPAVLILNIILLVIYFLIVPKISDVMLKFWSAPQFAQYAAGGSATITFPVMMRMFQYMPLISLGISVILMIAIASKTSGEATM